MPDISRRRFLTGAAGAGSLVLLPGCGAGTRGDRDPNTIIYWDLIDPGMQGNPRSTALRESLEKFEADNPGLHVEVQTIPWPQISSQFLQASAADDPPDVVRLLAWDLPKHVDAGDLVSLDQFADDAYRDDWLLGWDTLTFDGEKLAVPMEYRASTLFTRHDYRGSGRLPATWDELLAEGRESRAAARSPVMQGFGRAAGGTVITEPLVSYLWDAGLEVFDESGRVGFDDSTGYDVFACFADLVLQGDTPSAATNYQYEDVYQSIKAGTSVFSLFGSHRGAAARADTGLSTDELSMERLPSMAGNDVTPAHVMGWTYVIPQGASDPEASWRLIEHFTTPESQIAQVGLTGELPTRATPYQADWFSSDEGAESTRLAEWFQQGRTLDYSTQWARFGEMCSEALTTMILNGDSADKAVQQLAVNYNDLVD